jgi:hypothetical protein
LFNVGGNLITQGYQGQVNALSPYQSYLQGATGLEALGQQPLEMGASIGGRNVNTSGANALYQGGISAAKTAQGGNQYSPIGSFLSGVSSSPTFAGGVNKLFSPQQTSYQDLIQGSTLGAGWETPAGYAANYG